MVHKPRTDTRKIDPHIDAQRAQIARRTDARTQQMCRAVNGAGAQDHLASTVLHIASTDAGTDAGAHRSIEQQRAYRGLGADRQIRARPRSAVQVTDSSRNPALVTIGYGDREMTILEHTVLVRQVLAARLLECVGRGACMRAPLIAWNPPDRNPTFLAMQRPVAIQIALHLAEIRQHIVPCPAGSATRFPFIVVGWRAAIGELAVDRRPTAQHTRLLIFAQRRQVRGIVVRYRLRANFQFRPVKARIEIRDARIAVGDLGWDVVFRRILSGFTQQHTVAAARRKPVGQYRTSRPSTDDDCVVLHWVRP